MDNTSLLLNECQELFNDKVQALEEIKRLDAEISKLKDALDAFLSDIDYNGAPSADTIMKANRVLGYQ